MQNNYTTLLGLWKRIYELMVAKNEHLIIPYFHLILSVLIGNVKVSFAGKYEHVKIFINSIQPSGTGKGTVTNVVGVVLSNLGKRVEKVNKFTEAAIIGTIVESSKDDEDNIRYGLLYNNDYIDVDEASVLFSSSGHKEDLLQCINGYYDSMTMFKSLRLGNIKYTGNAVLSTSTFFTRDIQSVLLTGIIPRTFTTYKTYSTEEIKIISKEQDKLAIVDLQRDIIPIITQIGEIIKNIDYTQYRKKGKEYIVVMPQEVSTYFGSEYDTLFDKMLIEELEDKDAIDVVNTFRIRGKLIARKLMAHYSVINGEPEISKESADKALEIMKEYFNNILDLLVDIYELDKYKSHEQEKRHKEAVRKSKLLDFIDKYPGLSTTEIQDTIRKNLKAFGGGKHPLFNMLKEFADDGTIYTELIGHRKLHFRSEKKFKEWKNNNIS